MNDQTKIKVAIITAGVLPSPAVAGGAVESLLDYLIEDNERNNNYDLTVYTCFNSEASRISKSYNYTNIKFIINENPYSKTASFINSLLLRIIKKPYKSHYIKEVLKDVENSNYDLIIVENRIYYGLLIKNNRNVVLHLHNDYINEKTNNLKAVLESYKEIWCVSRYIENKVRNANGERTLTIYNGIDLDAFKQNRDVSLLKNKYNISDNKKVLIYTGRLTPYKGVLYLIKAFKELASKNDYLLLIAGDYDKSYSRWQSFKKEVIDNCRDEKNIILYGRVSQDVVRELYSISDIGIVPSIVNESFCLSALEMLASGLPVICTDAGALPEIVDSGCGVIVPRENIVENIKKAIESSEILSINKERCIERARKFPKEVFIDNVNNRIKYLIENSNII